MNVPDLPDEAAVEIDGRELKLTNLDKPFWPELGITKGDLIRYYAGSRPAPPAPRRPRDGDEALSRTAPTANSSS